MAVTKERIASDTGERDAKMLAFHEARAAAAEATVQLVVLKLQAASGFSTLAGHLAWSQNLACVLVVSDMIDLFESAKLLFDEGILGFVEALNVALYELSPGTYAYYVPMGDTEGRILFKSVS